MAPVDRVKVGSQGLEVSKQGLELMGLSTFHGPPTPEPQAIELILHLVLYSLESLSWAPAPK